MAQQDQKNYIGQEVANGIAPQKGPRIVALSLDFSAQASFDVNLTSMQEQDRIEFIQGVFADNSSNPAELIILNNRTKQRVTFCAFSSGYKALFCPNQPQLTISSNGGVNVDLCLTSFPVANETLLCAASVPISGQVTIAVTGTAVALASKFLGTGVIVKAKLSNSADIMVGDSTVTNTEDGTGNGAILSPGDSISVGVKNSNAIFVNGTAGDIVSFIGS